MSMDQIELFSLKEDPNLWEELVRTEIALSHSDPIAKDVIESMYWEEDRRTAFQKLNRSVDWTIDSRRREWLPAKDR